MAGLPRVNQEPHDDYAGWASGNSRSCTAAAANSKAAQPARAPQALDHTKYVPNSTDQYRVRLYLRSSGNLTPAAGGLDS